MSYKPVFVEIMLTPQSRAHSKYERSVAPYAPAPK